VRGNDCGTENSITAEPAVNDGEVIATLAERVLGRVAAEDIVRPGTDEVIVAKGELIDELLSDAIDVAGVASARLVVLRRVVNSRSKRHRNQVRSNSKTRRP